MRNIIAVATVTLLLIAAPLRCSADQTPAPQGATLAASASPSNDKDALPPSQQVPATITRLLSSSGPITGKDDQGHPAKGSVGLNEDLLVQVAPAPPYLDASKYALFFDGREVKGLDEPVYDRARQSLVFRLKRNDKNKDLWAALLGSPSSDTVTVAVSLGERSSDPKSPSRSSAGVDGSDKLKIDVLPPWRLAIALIVIASVVALLWGHARHNTTLRDNLLPQLAPERQPYSLARWQMAFWFTLIFSSFVLLFLLLWDYNTISPQALTLMGISGATALAAVGVDVIKDSPADAVNRGLRALGLNSYDDVLRVRQEIKDREAELEKKKKDLAALGPPPAPPAADPKRIPLEARITELQLEIQDRDNRMSTYDARVVPFVSQGWFRDLTTDLNGAAIHRLQVFCWTWVLGAVFLVGVYRDLAMPEFSATLLALMGISSAGYVGFKYPEANN